MSPESPLGWLHDIIHVANDPAFLKSFIKPLMQTESAVSEGRKTCHDLCRHLHYFGLSFSIIFCQQEYCIKTFPPQKPDHTFRAIWKPDFLHLSRNISMSRNLFDFYNTFSSGRLFLLWVYQNVNCSTTINFQFFTTENAAMNHLLLNLPEHKATSKSCILDHVQHMASKAHLPADEPRLEGPLPQPPGSEQARNNPVDGHCGLTLLPDLGPHKNHCKKEGS